MDLDLKDRKILYELDKNCRQSNSQIANKVSLSKQVINYRIRRLEDNNIITNYQALPYDVSFEDPSGIRMGVQEMTRFGMGESDFEQLATLVKGAISGSNVKDKIIQFRKQFLSMHYSLPPGETASLAANLVYGLFSDSDYAHTFVDNLKTIALQ